MPGPTARADLAAVLHDIRHDEDFRMSRHVVLIRDVRLELSEISAERDVPLRRKILIAEQEDRVVAQHLVEASDGVWRCGPRHVDAMDFHADGRR